MTRLVIATLTIATLNLFPVAAYAETTNPGEKETGAIAAQSTVPENLEFRKLPKPQPNESLPANLAFRKLPKPQSSALLFVQPPTQNPSTVWSISGNMMLPQMDGAAIQATDIWDEPNLQTARLVNLGEGIDLMIGRGQNAEVGGVVLGVNLEF
jgi:hypothetical protein